jgi:hypothetical protein
MARLSLYDAPVQSVPARLAFQRVARDSNRIRELEESNHRLIAALDEIQGAAHHVSAWARLPVQLEAVLETARQVREAYNLS